MTLLIVDMEGCVLKTPRTHQSESCDTRRVSIGLGVGIALAPFIFAWFLLRDGYSTLARSLGLGWLGFFALGYVASLAEPEEEIAADHKLAEAEATATPLPTGKSAAARSPRPGRLPGEPDCTLTSETPGWDLVKTNAILTAERYALAHKSKAAFGNADGKPFFQIDGAYKGQYTLIMSNDQVALAQLVPLFDFCTPADRLDPEGKLWKVVLAKLNGEPF